MAYSSAEVKSGILIIVSFILLLVLTFIVGNFIAGSTENYQIRFGYVAGLEVNAPVYFAGKEVGKVDKIEVVSGKERPIIVKVRLATDIKVREDSGAFVDTLGLLGEKFVEISAGTEKAAVIEPGSTIEGTDPIPMYLLIQKMNLLADRMDLLTESLNPMMIRLDDLLAEHQDEIGKLIVNVQETSGSLRDILAGQQEEIAKTIANFHETSANVRDMTHDLKFRPWRLVRKG